MKKVFLICNAHLDPVWQWQWQEGVACALSTFRTAADLCEEFDDFIFCHNEVILYKWVEQYEPELFERIKALVKKGKWRIMGGWYLQPDCNVISGESFVRQMEVGGRYFKEKFDVRPKVAMNFDPFGHPKGLVQLLRLAGFDGYLICRPLPWDMDTQGREDFTWNGFDGTSIKVHRSNSMYASGTGHAMDKIKTYIDDPAKDAEVEVQTDIRSTAHGEIVGDCRMVLWGVGNHGGGPSRKDIADINRYKASNNDVEMLHSYPEQYFTVASDQFKHVEINSTLGRCMMGTYSSMSRIKKKYRKAESRYYITERICSHAASEGKMEYPQEKLDRIMEDIMLAQFHDILSGGAIEDAINDSIDLLGRALQSLSELYNEAFFALTRHLDKVREREYPIVVYNPYPYALDTDITTEFMLYYESDGKGWQLPTIYDGEKQLTVQLEKEDSNIPFDWRKRIVFRAHLEPMTVARFSCYTSGGEKPKNPDMPEDRTFKNDRISVRFDNHGRICSYKVDGKEYLKDGIRICVYKDNEDSWGFFNRKMDNLQGEFILATDSTASRIAGIKAKEIPALRIIESGEVRTVIEGVYVWEESWAVVRYYVSAVDAKVDIKVRLFNAHRDVLYKLEVPTVLRDGRFDARIAYGVEDQINDGKEAVALSWISVAEGDDSVLLANDGCFSCSLENGVLGQTLMRACAYCSHVGGDILVPQDRFSTRGDMGEHNYTFTLYAGEGKTVRREADRIAELINTPPFALNIYPEAKGEPTKSFVKVEGTASLTTVKPAKDGGYILRLFNSCDEESASTVVLPDCSTEVSLRPMQVVSLLYKDGEIKQTKLLDI
ncbi:MAG: hypothetical protein IKK58_02710 [Clostridia bacterium]|nr:hypothetical protein [Clostridia bacterium]